jgi:hypothetical protein
MTAGAGSTRQWQVGQAHLTGWDMMVSWVIVGALLGRVKGGEEMKR